MEFSIENQKLQMVSMMQDNVEMEMKVKTLQHRYRLTYINA